MADEYGMFLNVMSKQKSGTFVTLLFSSRLRVSFLLPLFLLFQLLPAAVVGKALNKVRKDGAPVSCLCPERASFDKI